MTRQVIGACLSILVVGLLTACLVEPQTPLAPPLLSLQPTNAPSDTFPLATVTAVDAVVPTIVVSDPSVALAAAVSALAAVTGAQPADIVVVDQPLPVQWNDSSLGCPQPGQAYAQVVTPGYLYTLTVDDMTYSVHTDLVGAAVVCFNESDPIGSETVPDPVAAEFIAQASADLARRLNVAPDTIILVSSEAVEWSDASIGCPEPGETYAQVITFGYRIILARAEQHYEYHTDQHRMLLCSDPTE